jgi:hypothetical protein
MEAPLEASSRFLITFSTQKQSTATETGQDKVFGNLLSLSFHLYTVLQIKAEDTVATETEEVEIPTNPHLI